MARSCPGGDSIDRSSWPVLTNTEVSRRPSHRSSRSVLFAILCLLFSIILPFSVFFFSPRSLASLFPASLLFLCFLWPTCPPSQFSKERAVHTRSWNLWNAWSLCCSWLTLCLADSRVVSVRFSYNIIIPAKGLITHLSFCVDTVAPHPYLVLLAFRHHKTQ